MQVPIILYAWNNIGWLAKEAKLRKLCKKRHDCQREKKYCCHKFNRVFLVRKIFRGHGVVMLVHWAASYLFSCPLPTCHKQQLFMASSIGPTLDPTSTNVACFLWYCRHVLLASLQWGNIKQWRWQLWIGFFNFTLPHKLMQLVNDILHLNGFFVPSVCIQLVSWTCKFAAYIGADNYTFLQHSGHVSFVCWIKIQWTTDNSQSEAVCSLVEHFLISRDSSSLRF